MSENQGLNKKCQPSWDSAMFDHGELPLCSGVVPEFYINQNIERLVELAEKEDGPSIEVTGNYGYHTYEIEKGTYGEFDKIVEEVEEAGDALAQENKIMVLVELSDIVLAIHGYVEKHYNMTMDDIVTMAKATKRAFDSGQRKPK